MTVKYTRIELSVMKVHKKAVRRCLRCDKEFDSEHVGNRICKPCNIINAEISLNPFSSVDGVSLYSFDDEVN